MGSRLFSNTTNLLGGHDFLNATDRQKIAQLLRISVEKIPSQNSWAYDQIVDQDREIGSAQEIISGRDLPRNEPSRCGRA